MVSYLLNLIYLLLLILFSPWLLYAAARKGKYREGFAAKFLGRVPIRKGEHFCVWLHAVSVGEVKLLETLIDQIEHRFPDWRCVISTTTMTGLALAKRKYAAHTVFYCPLDFSWAVGTAMRRIRPDLLLLAELELWPNLIRTARRRGAKVAIVNGRLSDHSLKGYRRIRPFVAYLLRSIDLIAVQNDPYAERFVTLGARPESVHVAGSVKFDGAETDRDNPATRRLAKLAGIAPQDVVFLAGSTQDPEESLALATFRELSAEHSRLRLILVPRHPDRFPVVAKMLGASGVRWQLRSNLQRDGADPLARVLLVDAVGELGAWWGTATIAFVGGSMGRRGGQNMIEPAAYGAAVSFGPNTQNFRDVSSLLLDAGAATVIHDGHELTTLVRRCLEKPQFAEKLGRKASELVAQQLGAAERTVDLIAALAEGSVCNLSRTSYFQLPTSNFQLPTSNARELLRP